MPDNTPTPPPLLVDSRTAARMLSISPRTLFSLTKVGELPCVRIFRRVLYNVETLRAYAAWWENGEDTPGAAAAPSSESRRADGGQVDG